MRLAFKLVVALLVIALGLWLLLRPGPGPGAPVPDTNAGIVEDEPSAAVRPEREPDGSITTKETRVSRNDRDELHRRIVESLARRGESIEGRGPPTNDAAPDEGAEPEQEQEPEHGSIRNRLGDLDGWGNAMTKLLNEDLAPLTDECFEAAVERNPDIGRYVEIEFSVIADEDIGGVVEEARMGPRNEALEPEFIECVRQSTLSTIFPPPPGSGRQDIMLSLRFDEE